MSVYERADVEYKGTAEVTGLERSVRRALVDTRGSRSVLVVSERHAWRILAAYRKEGVAASKAPK